MPTIVTGFDGFGPHDINPSQQAVESLASNLADSKPRTKKPLHLAGSPLQTLILPTSSSRGWETLKETLAKLEKKGKEKDSPLLIVMCGVAQDRKKIGLERFALNVRDYRIPDNDGSQLCDQPIDIKAELAYKCQLPLARLRDHLIAKGFSSEVSNHAGSYICNEVYFQCLRALQEQEEFNNRTRAAVFVHLPLPLSYARLEAGLTNDQEQEKITLAKKKTKGKAHPARAKQEIQNDRQVTQTNPQEVIKIYSQALEEIIRWSQGFLAEISC